MIESIVNVRGFFESAGVVYIKKNRFGRGIDPEREDSSYFRENREEFGKLNELYGRFLTEGYIVPSFLEKIDDSVGYGLFARELILPGEYVAEYAGVVEQATPVYEGERKENGLHPNDYAIEYPVLDRKGFSLQVNALAEGNESRFINHSFHPNLQVEHSLIEGRWAIFFIAIREIREKEQLLFDYGDQYWSTEERELVIF